MDAIETIKQTMKRFSLSDVHRPYQQFGAIKGILLHQGETDAYNDQWRKEVRKIYRDLPKEKLVFVFQSADGRATTDVDLK